MLLSCFDRAGDDSSHHRLRVSPGLAWVKSFSLSLCTWGLVWGGGLHWQSGSQMSTEGSLGRMVWGSSASAQTPSPNASPGDITDDAVRRYARAGLLIENSRRQLEQELGRERIAGMACHEIAGTRGVDQAIVNSCRQFREFVTASELTQEQFNLIYNQQQTDLALAQRVLREMARQCLDTSDSLAPSFCQDTVRPVMQRQCDQGAISAPDVCDRLRQPLPPPTGN